MMNNNTMTTHIAHLYLRLLRNLAALLRQFTAALLRWLRYSQAYHLAVIVRCDAHLRVHDGLLYAAYGLLVPRLDGYGARVGRADVGNLVQRHHHAVPKWITLQ